MKSLPIVLLLVATALAIPVPWSQDWPVEEIKCTNSRFKVNNIYEFKYEALSLTTVEGTSEKGTGLRYRCDVEIRVPEPCKLVLNVDKCALRHLDDIEELTKLGRHETSKDFESTIAMYDIVAHVDNGVITKVLAHPDEPKHILNIKKGILNMVSLGFQPEDAEDVVEIAAPCLSGNCTGIRRVLERREGKEAELEITKDLTKCEGRPIAGLESNSTLSYIWSTPIVDKFITSNQTCSYELEWDAIKRVKCRESHGFWPFSYDGTKGVRTEVAQDLKFSQKDKVNSVTPIRDEASRYVTDLTFEHDDEETMKIDDPTYATETLKTLVKGSIEEISMDTPQLFSQFVGAIRKLNNESIHELYERSINCPLYYESCRDNPVKVELIKTFTHDALVQCGTMECFRVLNTAIIEGEISKPVADFIMYTMALRDYPELTLIEETLRVAFYNRSQSTFLPLGIMINNYWNNNPSLRNDRRLPDEIHNSIAFFSSIIGYDCSTPSNVIDGGVIAEHQRQIYTALKAIGNIGQAALHYDSSHYQVDEMMATRLIRCAENKAIPRNISNAAVQAMRKFEIRRDIRDSLKRILLKTDEDVELRLASYLMIMRSEPHVTDVADVLHMLSDEPITQVRAFVYSHLDNILESDSKAVEELKKTVREALRDESLPEYPRDIRRLSRNIELSKVVNISQFDGIISYLNKTFNSTLFNNTIAQLLNVNKTLGGSIESNLIHNPETYMMRAAMLKTSMNLLGKEWTMFETGVDMQGFEPTLEAIFGPQGFFPDNILGSLFSIIDEKIIKVLRELYNTAEPHVMDVVNADMNEMPNVISEKAKATSDYVYDSYSKMTGKQKRSITDTLQERVEELTRLLPNSIHENIQDIHEQISKMPLSPAASIYLRLLDQEVGFLTLDDVINMIPKVNLTKDGLMQMAMKMVQKAQNGIEYNITKSMVFMDKEFRLPSVIGLPIRCNVNGTVSVGLRLRAKLGMQLPKVFVAGRFAPSGAINMIGSMSAELPQFTSHAVMANATVYHASRLEGNITMDGPHIKFNLNNTSPMNLFNFSTNFYLLNTTGVAHYVPGVQQDRVENVRCVTDALDMDLIGLDLCTSYAYPNASYAERAPRFPMTGPMSFNVTLVNLDKTLKTVTFEAFYKQIKSAPKSGVRRIMRRSTTKPAVDITDTVVFKFSAPGDKFKREISSTAAFDRSKTEFRYNFSIPEANVTFFSGIMNVTCPKTKSSGFHFVTNVTALRPEYNASVSLTLKDGTTMEKTNYTAVWNASIMNLYTSVVSQYVQDARTMMASTNVTYPWDRETPLWRQLAWPFTGYSIRPHNYRQDFILLKSVKNQQFKTVDRSSLLLLSVFNQNFTIKSDLITDDRYYTNEMMIDFENSYNNLRILNITAKSETRPDRKFIKLSAERFGHGVFGQYDSIKSLTEKNFTITYGYEGDKKQILESFKVFENQPSVMLWFGDSAYHMEKISYNVSHTLCVRDESLHHNRWQKMVHFNTSFPKPLTSERLNFSLSARVTDESMKTCNNYSYAAQFNTSVPFLWFHNMVQTKLVNGSDGIEMRFNDTTTELFSGKQFIIDDRFNYIWKTMNATWEFNVMSPVYNYSFNVTMYNSTESGYVFDYSSVQNNTLLHLFNITHGGNFSVAPRNISLIGAFWHPWVQVDIANVLHKNGPIQEFSIANIRALISDIRERVMIFDVDGVKLIGEDLLTKTLESSLNLTNTIVFRTPWLVNATLNHTTSFDFSMINHSMNVEVVRPRTNVGILASTSAFLNRDRLSAGFNTSMIGNRFFNTSSNVSFALRRADERALAVDFINNHTFTSPIANITVGGLYNVHNMSRPWRFSNINGSLGYDVSTPIVNSRMNSSFIMDDFTHFLKFGGIEAALNHNISSRWLNWNTNGSFIIDDFRSLVNYSRINASLVTDLKSILGNMSQNVNMDVDNMNGVFKFDKIGGNITQEIDSIFGKSVFNTGLDLDEVFSPFNFTKINGSINYNMTSRFVNLTMSNLMELKEFAKLWKFGKINGTMMWSLNTSFANATLKHKVDFDNVINPINFNRINASLEHEFNSKYANASLKQAYGIFGMRSYLTFDRANTSIKGEVKTPFINTSIAHEMDVQNMEGPFRMTFANVSLHGRVDNRFLNVSTTNGMEWNNMRGVFSFDRINGSHKFIVSSPLGVMDTFGELVFDEFMNLTSFRLVNATVAMNISSRYHNFTTRVGHEMHNFRSLFNFDRIQTRERTTVNNCLMTHDGETDVSFNNFRSLFEFDSILGNLEAKTMTIIGGTNQTYNFDLRNSRGLFNFQRLIGSANVNTRARWFNMTVNNNMDFNEFTKLTSFRSTNLYSYVDIKTPLINSTNEMRYDDNDHREAFYFNRIFAGHRWELTTPFTSFVTESDAELQHFYEMFKFNLAHFNNGMKFDSRVANFSSNHGVHMDGFRSMFNFDRVFTGGLTSLSTSLGKHDSNIDISFNNFRSMLNYDRVASVAESHFVSRYLNNSYVFDAEINNQRSLFNLDRFGGNANMRFNTRWYNMTTDGAFGIHNVRKAFDFDIFTTEGSWNVSTPILRTGSMAGAEFTGFRSLLNFDRINATAKMNVSSRWLNVSTEGKHGLHGVRHIFVFDRMNTTGRLNISTPIIETNNMIGLDMHNFTKLWRFTRVNGTGIMNVSSRWLNITNEGMFGLHNVSTPWRFERINGTTKMNISTPIIKTNSMAGVEFNNFTNLFNFSRVNGTGNFNVSSRWLNTTTEGEFGFHNFTRLFTFERINGSAKMMLRTPFFNQSSMGGVEFNNFTSLFNFSRINGTGNFNVSSRWLNTTTEGEFGFHNFSRIFTFERINGSARMSIRTPFFNQSSMGGLEFNNFTSLFNFSRINGTANMTLASRYFNGTSQAEIGFHNFSKIFHFERINSSLRMNASTPVANVSFVAGSEHNNFTSLFTFSCMNYSSALELKSMIGDFNMDGLVDFCNFTSLLDYGSITGSHKMNLKSKFVNITTFNALEDKNRFRLVTFERFNITSLANMTTPWHKTSMNGSFEVTNGNGILNYDRVALNLTTEFLTRWFNMTSNSSVSLEDFRSLFNFTMLNSTFLANVTTPFANTGFNGTFLINNVTSWRHHNINQSIQFRFNSPMFNSSMIHEWNITNFLTFSQKFIMDHNLRILGKEAGLIFTDKVNNDFVLFNVTVPQLNGSVCALAELNKFGDLLNMSLFRQTKENVNITDLNWILMLNSSDVIYSNFTWNPETLRAIRTVSGDMVNKTINATLQAFNKTMCAVNKTIEATRRAINMTVHGLNYTYNNPMEVVRMYVNGSLVDATIVRVDIAKVWLNQTLNTTLYYGRAVVFYSNQTWRMMNFTSVNSTVESFVEAIKMTPLNVPIQLVNTTIRRMDFTSANSTITSILREIDNAKVNKTVITVISKLNDTVEIASKKLNETLIFVNATATKAIVFASQKLNETIVFLNETWRDGNFSSINATIDTILSALNRTRLNTTIVFLNETWRMSNFTTVNSTIDSLIAALNRTRLNTTILFVNQTWQQLNFTSINSTVESLKQVVNFTRINATIEELLSRVNLTALNATMYEMIGMVNITNLNETLMNYTNLVINEIQRIAMNDSHPINKFTIRYFNNTAYNLTITYYPIVKEFTTTNFNKYAPIVRNFTLTYYNLGKNLTEKYYPIMYNLTVTYYPHAVNYSMVAFNYTRNMTLQAYNLTRVYSEVLYNKSLFAYNYTANYSMQAYNLTSAYSVIAFNKTRNYTLWLVNYTRPHRELLVNYTINVTNMALNKAVNYSLQVIEYTANKTEWAKEHHKEYIEYAIRMLKDATSSGNDKSIVFLNKADKYLKEAVKYALTKGKPVAMYLLKISKNETHLINRLPMRYYNKTIYVIGQEVGQKIMIDGMAIILKEDNTLNTYLKKITDMTAMELGSYMLSKGKEYKTYVQGNVTYYVTVAKSNVTYWANYTLETAPMATLNLIGNATVKANTTVLWLNSTRSQPLNVTLRQVEMYVNQTVLEVVDYLNKTLNGSTEMLLNMTWDGINKTMHYANRTIIFVNETICYVRNTSVKVWRFINEETPLVNMTLDYVNKTVNFTMTYVNQTIEMTWDYIDEGKNITLFYAQKGKNITLKAIGYVRNYTKDLELEVFKVAANRALNLTKEYAQWSLDYTKGYAEWSVNYTKDYARAGVEYVNGTMAGWFIRYYNIHNMPYNLYNITYTHLNNTPEYLRQMVEFNKRFTVDTLNRIGRLEDNSFAINISHPLNITSFRKFPNLTNDQWMVINNATDKVALYALQAREYYELAREMSMETYEDAKEYLTEMYDRQSPYIEEKMAQLKAKYEELKLKIEELRERIPEYRENAMEKYEIFRANWPMYKQQMKEKIQELREQIPSWEEIKAMPEWIKSEIDIIINDFVEQWPETYVEIRNEIISLPNKYLLLKYKLNAFLEEMEFDIPMECQRMIDNVIDYPAMHREAQKVCNSIPALRLEAEEKYEELMRYVEIARVYVELKLEELCTMRPTECEKVKEYWTSVSTIDAPFVQQKLEEYIPPTWDDAKLQANEKFQELKVKIEELKVEAQIKIDELKVKANELKVKARELKEDLKVKYSEMKELILQEIPNTLEHIDYAIVQIRNAVEGTLNALSEQLRVLIDRYYPSLRKYIDQIIASIAGLKPVLDKEATAMIFGPLGVLTFDKKLYELPGYRDSACTYILARDFVDRNFTLLADQNAITAVFPSSIVSINGDSEVFVNGNPESTELPYQSLNRDVTVVRDGPWVNITTTYGITINCQEKHFLCTMKLSSWYHGKTQGLLGTFDREMHNDMRKPDQTNATTLIEFINSYEVSGHAMCKIPPGGRNVLPPLTGICDEPVSAKIQLCEDLFMDEHSSLSEAFNKISAGPFFAMCNHMARDCREVCDVVHGYVSVSRDEGIMIEHSPRCDRCDAATPVDTKYNITKIPETTSDIVFVVSENQRMDEGRRTKTLLWELVQKIEKTLSKQGIYNNRYSLVAFGGEGVHAPAHTHTSNSKVFATSTEFKSGIDSLEFDGEFQTDAMEALAWATDLHWRPEATRTIVLVTEAERMEPYNSSLTYLEVQQMLDANSINLNVFSVYESIMKDGKEPVLGINYDMTLLTTKRTAADDLAKLKLPKGNYAKMATASKGAMFRVDMLLNSDISRGDFNAQISKVLRNSILNEQESVTYKACMCNMDKHSCPVQECKSIRL